MSPNEELALYGQLALAQTRAALSYRSEAIASVGVVALRVGLLVYVWEAAFASQTTHDGQALRGVITAVTLGNLQLLLIRPMLVWHVQRRVHDGHIAADLVRPTPFLGQLMSYQIGATAAMLPFVFIAFMMAIALGLVAPPASLSGLILYVPSLLLAYLISALIGMILAVTSFWTVQAVGLAVINEFASQFFGGALIPLILLPAELAAIAAVLPFASQVSVPVSIYTGTLTQTTSIAIALCVQGLWVVALALMTLFIWRAARRNVAIHGG